MFSQSRLDLFTALNVLADELKQVRQAGPPALPDPAAQLLPLLEYAVSNAHVRLRRGWEGAGAESAAEHIRNALQILGGARDAGLPLTGADLDAIDTRLRAALEGLAQ